MSIDKIMSKDVVAVTMGDTLATVQKIFNETNFHHLLVVDNKKLVGILSDRDLFKALSPNIGTITETVKDKALLNKKAHQIMARHPITLLSDASVYDAIAVLNHKNISCIPIVDDNRMPIGVLSWRDILNFIEKKHNEVTKN